MAHGCKLLMQCYQQLNQPTVVPIIKYVSTHLAILKKQIMIILYILDIGWQTVSAHKRMSI